MIDISVENTLVSYLKEKQILNEEDGYNVHYCKGGVSATVAFVYAGKKQMIVKQALPRLKVKEEWLCDPARMLVEKEGNEVYHRLVPENVPEVYFYDQENCVYGREAAPETCTMWKQNLLSGLLDFDVAHKAIESLVTVHNECAHSTEIEKKFGDKKIFYDLRVSPYIEFTVGKHPELEGIGKILSDELMKAGISLVHGDFSPKNIMVDGRKIYILDFEVAHYGHPAFDLAFFSNHFILKATKNSQWSAGYLAMLRYMLGIYFKEMHFIDMEEFTRVYIPLLGMLMMARIDGKSPVEYLTEEDDKDFVRKLAGAIIFSDLRDVADLMEFLEKAFKERGKYGKV